MTPSALLVIDDLIDDYGFRICLLGADDRIRMVLSKPHRYISETFEQGQFYHIMIFCEPQKDWNGRHIAYCKGCTFFLYDYDPDALEHGVPVLNIDKSGQIISFMHNLSSIPQTFWFNLDNYEPKSSDVCQINPFITPDCSKKLDTYNIKQTIKVLNNHYKDTGTRHFVFHNSPETLMGSFLYVQTLAEILERMKSDVKVYYVTGSVDAHDKYQAFLDSQKTPITSQVGILSIQFLQQGLLYSHTDHGTKTFEVKYTRGSRPRSKYFVNFNRMARPHRTMLVGMLQREGLLEKGYVSYGESGNSYMCSPELWALHDEIADKVPMILDVPDLVNTNPNDIDDSSIPYYQDSYFSVVTETCFFSSFKYAEATLEDNLWHTTFMSEKIWKPILAKHPFIIVSTPGFLQELHKLGYKTFSSWIDESYNDIQDDWLRMEAIVKEISRLCELSHAEWNQMLTEMAPVLEYNYKLFMSGTGHLIKDTTGLYAPVV